MQAAMFTHEDLPLFSSTCQRAEVEPFIPQQAARQTTFDVVTMVADDNTCPICHGDGTVSVTEWYTDGTGCARFVDYEEPCSCQAGRRLYWAITHPVNPDLHN